MSPGGVKIVLLGAFGPNYRARLTERGKMKTLAILLALGAGLAYLPLRHADREPDLIDKLQAQTSAQNLLAMFETPGDYQLVRAVVDAPDHPRPSWMLKFKAGDGRHYTCLVDARTGSLAHVSSTAIEPRARRANRTGRAFFSSSTAAHSHIVSRLKKVFPSVALRETQFSLSSSVGEASYSARLLSKGYPFIYPVAEVSVSLDSQDGSLLEYSAQVDMPATPTPPTNIVSRNVACAKALGKVLPAEDIDGEVLGWYKKRDSSDVALAWIFHYRKSAVTINATTCEVIDVATKK